MIWDGDTYREAVVQYLKRTGADVADRACYQFGIFTGTTFVFIYQMFRKYGIPVKKILAFDSFEGLPDEAPGVQKHPVWQKNEFNAKYIFQNQNTHAIIDQIMCKLPDTGIPVDWFEGYFSDVLTDAWLDKEMPLPAFWVDIDVDLYISARQVLDFMLAHRLIVPGTIISYDDWGGTEEYKGGESLAHKEMCEKYAMECECIHRVANGEHVQIAFVVTKVRQ